MALKRFHYNDTKKQSKRFHSLKGSTLNGTKNSKGSTGNRTKNSKGSTVNGTKKQ